MKQRLPDAELEVLTVLWKIGESTAKEIRENLPDDRQLNHATVSTLLKRLESKKFVERRKSDGREFIFVALANPDETRQNLVGQLLNRAFEGSGIELVNALFQSRPPSIEEIDSIQAMLDELKNKERQSSRAKSKKQGKKK